VEMDGWTNNPKKLHYQRLCSEKHTQPTFERHRHENGHQWGKCYRLVAALFRGLWCPLRPNTAYGLSGVNIELADLLPRFLPELLTKMHTESHLKNWVDGHIKAWYNDELTLKVTCGASNMPEISIQVYEFIPKGIELVKQKQYIVPPAENERVAITKESPPLGMKRIKHQDAKKYERYIDDILENHLDNFTELCWMEDTDDFLKKLLKLITPSPFTLPN
jgi:hypothetical protein